MPRGSRQMNFIQNYIDGQFVAGRREFPDVNPADGRPIARVSEADRCLVDRAVESAGGALAGSWSRTTARERASCLRNIADAIDRRFDGFVAAEVADTGKPISLAAKLDVPRAAANFRIFADLISTTGLESFQTEMADGAGALNYAIRKPLGVVAII